MMVLGATVYFFQRHSQFPTWRRLGVLNFYWQTIRIPQSVSFFPLPFNLASLPKELKEPYPHDSK